MKLCTTITALCLCVATATSLPQGQGTTPGVPGYTQLEGDQIKYLQNRGFGSTHRTFRPTVAYEEEEEHVEQDRVPEPTQDRQPTFANYPGQARTTPVKAYATASPKITYYARQGQEEQYRRAGGQSSNKLEEEEEEKEEEEEPDRLTQLLPQTKFQCAGMKTGYYADEDLGCEVFHYCHENARHSWICPEGFTFHQIQLICVPPGGDNICEKSSDYHFVNDYLYKPVNLQEYQQKPNTTLRYSDRYFPDSYRPRYDDDDGEYRRPSHQHSVRVSNQARYQSIPVQSSTFRPQTPLGQVFRSPEEINISLQQRRPQQYAAQ